MKKFTYIKGKEIKTYKDILEAVDGFIIDQNYTSFAIDQINIKRDNKQKSLNCLKRITDAGDKVYARKKVYRSPVLSYELDDELETILFDFHRDIDFYDSEILVDRTMRKIKGIFDDWEAFKK